MPAPAYQGGTVPQIAPGKRLQWEPAQDCWVILYPEGMVKLNGSAAEVMRRIDGVRTVDAIVAELVQTFPGADLEPDVYKLLEVAHVNQWIRPKPGQ
jgi:pyrroloquinoline quinone biosynthesis protein D